MYNSVSFSLSSISCTRDASMYRIRIVRSFITILTRPVRSGIDELQANTFPIRIQRYSSSWPSGGRSRFISKPPSIGTLESANDMKLARSWIDDLTKSDIPREIVELNFSRSSGPGGQVSSILPRLTSSDGSCTWSILLRTSTKWTRSAPFARRWARGGFQSGQRLSWRRMSVNCSTRFSCQFTFTDIIFVSILSSQHMCFHLIHSSFRRLWRGPKHKMWRIALPRYFRASAWFPALTRLNFTA